MDGRNHFKLFLILIIPICILFFYADYTLYIPLLLGSFMLVDPDEDQKWFKGRFHRSVLSHTAIFPLLLSLCIYLPFKGTGLSFMGIFVVFNIPTMVHLFGDIYSKNRGGKYCVSAFYRRLSSNISTFIYLFNALILLAFDAWFFYGLFV